MADITREEAISRLKEGAPFSEIYEPVWEEALDMAIKALEQEPKTRHWIDCGEREIWYRCSECREKVWGGHRKYCPNCGAKMKSEVQE